MEITESMYYKIVEEGRRLVKEYLVENGVDITTMYGFYTASYGQLEVVKYLVDNGVDVTTEYGYHTARFGGLKAVKEVLGTPKEYSMEEVAEALGVQVDKLRIKKD